MVRFHFRAFDDGWIVFESASGTTHQLNSLSAFVADLLEAGPRTSDELVREAESAVGDPDTAAIRTALFDVLARFRTLGFVIEEHR